MTRAPALLLAVLAGTAGCGNAPGPDVPAGSAERGRAAIQEIGCGACHTIGGVDDASAQVGPSLKDFAAEQTIAGRLPNTVDNLVRWLRDPQTVSPGSLMPDLGIDDDTARDIAAYLYEH